MANVLLRLSELAGGVHTISRGMGVGKTDFGITIVDRQNIRDTATRRVRRRDAVDLLIHDLHDLGTERIPGPAGRPRNHTHELISVRDRHRQWCSDYSRS